jgi:hypothetical protein
MLIPSVLFGGLTAMVAWHISSLTSWLSPASAAPASTADSERLATLCRLSATWRWLGPLAADLGRLPGVRWLAREKSVALSLNRGATPVPFTPQEFIGTKAVEGLILGATLAMLWNSTGGTLLTTAGVGLATPVAWLMWSTYSLGRKARHRMLRVASRLPFAIDSLSLMLEAGANITEALETVSKADSAHPVSVELTRMRHEMTRGMTFRAAIENMDARLRLPAVQEFASATLVACDLGTPLKQVLNQLAEQMRMRQAQDIESAAGRAQVQLIQPATLMLVAAMTMVVAPFVLPLLGALANYK